MLLAKLQPYVFQLEFLYLATSRHGELFYKENIFGNLVTGNLADTEVAYIRFVQVCPLVPDNECADRFAVLLGRDAGYRVCCTTFLKEEYFLEQLALNY